MWKMLPLECWINIIARCTFSEWKVVLGLCKDFKDISTDFQVVSSVFRQPDAPVFVQEFRKGYSPMKMFKCQLARKYQAKLIYEAKRQRWWSFEGRWELVFNMYMYLYGAIESDILKFYKQSDWHESLFRQGWRKQFRCDRFPPAYISEFLDSIIPEISMDDFQGRLDRLPHILRCQNGVLDLKEKIFRPGEPKDYVSRTMGVAYCTYEPTDPNVLKCQKFLASIYPDPEDYAIFLSILADSMWYDHGRPRILYLQGPPTGGQEAIQKLVQKVFGGEKCYCGYYGSNLHPDENGVPSGIRIYCCSSIKSVENLYACLVKHSQSPLVETLEHKRVHTMKDFGEFEWDDMGKTLLWMMVNTFKR